MDLSKKINLSVKNQIGCNTPLLLGFNGKIKLSVFSKKSPFSSSLIFRKSSNFRRLKYSKIKGLYQKNQTVRYNQTGRLNTSVFANYFSGLDVNTWLQFIFGVFEIFFIVLINIFLPPYILKQNLKKDAIIFNYM